MQTSGRQLAAACWLHASWRLGCQLAAERLTCAADAWQAVSPAASFPASHVALHQATQNEQGFVDCKQPVQ